MPKPKLKARPVVRKKQEDDWQHCCRYCHYYENGKCWNKGNFFMLDEVDNVFRVAEDGILSQVLEEVLNDEPMVKSFMFSLEHILDKWGISQKRKKEFDEHFRECWSKFADFKLKEELDEKVSVCYQDFIDAHANSNESGIDIENPSEFVCKEWC